MSKKDFPKSVRKKSYNQIEKEYLEWQKKVRIFPNWTLYILLTISGLVGFAYSLIWAVAAYCAITLAQRQAHQNGYMDAIENERW